MTFYKIEGENFVCFTTKCDEYPSIDCYVLKLKVLK